ncbi:MAG: hypothetical protein H0U27_14265 [Nitrosopumilus sp.]|nr:hypothetical protein [Nitrosopumilus sp.]
MKIKSEEQYNLDEAIKSFHITKPLKIDLATTVADQVFIKQKKTSALTQDRFLYAIVFLLFVGSTIYCFSFLKQFSLPFILLIFISILCYFSLSLREYSVMSKRMLSLD